MKSTTEIDANRLYKLIQKTISFPYATVCKHHVALNILSMMEECGVDVSIDLIKAVSENSAGDEKALELLEQLTK